MIALTFGRRGLTPVLRQAQQSGFAAVVLGGKDVAGLIAEERNAKNLIQGVEHARRHGELAWMEACARRLGAVDSSTDGQLRLALVLASAGKLPEAGELLAGIPARVRTAALYIQARAILCARLGQAEEALRGFDQLPDGRSGHYPAPIVLPTAEAMIQGCRLEYALAFISQLHDRYPDHMLIRSMHARCLAYDGNREGAREILAVPADVLARAPLYERRQMREAAALVLSLAGWNNELLDYASDVLADDPTHWAMYYSVSEAAAFGYRAGDYDRIIARLPPAQAKTTEAISTLCRWMIDRGRVEEAKVLIEELRQRSPASFLNAALLLNIQHGSPAAVEDAFDDCIRCGIAPVGAVVSYGMYLYYFNEPRAGFQPALDVLEPHKHAAENNVSFQQTYLRCLIAADMPDTARSVYRGLPRGLRTSARLQPFEMYFAVLDGDGEKSTEAWIRFIRDSRHVCVNGKTGYPDTIALRYVERPGAVLLFATVYNGMVYLDWFLDHYRALGIDHFFITDNASNDGTVERLLREPDVSLFSNPGSFAASAFGIVWTNHQLQRFGVGHWCFHVDIDEGFVFPGHDRGRSLADLLSYLDDRSYRAVAAIELDMYPDHLGDAPKAELFSAHCHFDTDYRSICTEIPPYVLIQGGIRRRMTGLSLTMTKTPLIRVSPGFRYIECNHHTTHLPVADVTTALLHYKFVGDVANRLNEAIDRGEHFGGAVAYRRLRQATGQRKWEETLLSGFSRRYDGAKSLETAGLMRTSPAWEGFQTAR